MKNHRRIIIAIISIIATASLGIFLFNHPDLIKITTSNSEEVVLTTTQNFVKNLLISITCGGAIYIIFYAIPHDYKKANRKKEDEQ